MVATTTTTTTPAPKLGKVCQHDDLYNIVDSARASSAVGERSSTRIKKPTLTESQHASTPSADRHGESSIRGPISDEVVDNLVFKTAVIYPLNARQTALPEYFTRKGKLLRRWTEKYGVEVTRLQDEATAQRKAAPLNRRKKTAVQAEDNDDVHGSRAEFQEPHWPGLETQDNPQGCLLCESGTRDSRGSVCHSCRFAEDGDMVRPKKRQKTFAQAARSDIGDKTRKSQIPPRTSGNTFGQPVRTILPSDRAWSNRPAPFQEPISAIQRSDPAEDIAFPYQGLKSPTISVITCEGRDKEVSHGLEMPEVGSVAKGLTREESIAAGVEDYDPLKMAKVNPLLQSRVRRSPSSFQSSLTSGSSDVVRLPDDPSPESEPAQENLSVDIGQAPDSNVPANASKSHSEAIPRDAEPRFGREWLDDDEIGEMLDKLSNYLMQYTAAACAHPWPPHGRMSFLDIPCIQDEGFAGHAPLLDALRSVLDVPAGVSVKEKIESMKLAPEKSMWIRSILLHLVSKFVFESGSPFEDARPWKEGLEFLGVSADMIEQILQDNRIRTASSKPAEFSARIQHRSDGLVRELNATMMPLVGCNSEMNDFHTSISRLASDLNIRLCSFPAEYRPITTRIGESFVHDIHALETQGVGRPEQSLLDVIGKPVLLTTMFGVRERMPMPMATPHAAEARVCVKAKVKLWPPTAVVVVAAAAAAADASSPTLAERGSWNGPVDVNRH
ncbi:uncharacterized protein L3040_007910 [Drepanopeziza brunnea f. sp. 'multigermtubi']|uniref:Uncharacterized protein n=1 Tax=Marssonina brunnea f. sp. multigermtubi (strain MB_m1) TaxID=1072389 RepID=K1WZN3_MARBU|nr:uncharacterized protein MBM_07765 [Drepanopeziza brunnea f. sp. 'multigermtubi' MB_m1]EKD14088.1 hypothetical protein MBM_07765 [Drepanopeziza brunnea f. sp. 'multigermtubi' MB_m1]KAJ5035442.1 hypothetical protein L3040_007910 [Drepanopeziza brunnea f. sp. 'multigermtubi']